MILFGVIAFTLAHTCNALWNCAISKSRLIKKSEFRKHDASTSVCAFQVEVRVWLTGFLFSLTQGKWMSVVQLS